MRLSHHIFPYSKSSNSAIYRADLLLLILVLLTRISLSSAEVSLDSAIDRAYNVARLSTLEAAAEDEAKSYVRTASQPPNPSFFYERETLKGSSLTADSRETTAGFSAPLDFIWKRSARIEAAELTGEVSRFYLEDQRRHIAREVAVVFADHAANRLENERHEAAHAALERARNVAQAAVGTGDAPPTLMHRVDVALSRHVFEENRIQTELLEIRARLSSLIADDYSEPSTQGLSISEPIFADAKVAQKAALANRPDFKAAEAMFGLKQTERKVAQRDGLPEVSLEAAHKDDNLGRDGVFLGLSVELPIFDRNQGASLRAKSEAVRAEVAYHLARRMVEGEAKAAYNRWRQISENWQRVSDEIQASQFAAALLKATEANFEAGEVSLLEYLDAVESYLEVSEEEIKLERALKLAAIDLAHVTATPLIQ